VRVLGDAPPHTFVACIADGAGSAKHSDRGSAIVCEAIVSGAAQQFQARGTLKDLQVDEVVQWCEDARTKIRTEAEWIDSNLREFASTLCGAILTPESSFFFQIGDGAIILGNDDLYGVVFWPQSGEYANSTNFLTADEYRDRLEFIATDSRCSRLALMTDGLERIALRFDSQTPHGPFFDPLFRALQTTENIERLNDDLRNFLGSSSVKLRSDDDKTLILASREADGAA